MLEIPLVEVQLHGFGPDDVDFAVALHPKQIYLIFLQRGIALLDEGLPVIQDVGVHVFLGVDVDFF